MDALETATRIMDANLRKVERLLSTRFEDLEDLFDRAPFSRDICLAITVKEFMHDHSIECVKKGLAGFMSFKREQHARLGLAY